VKTLRRWALRLLAAGVIAAPRTGPAPGNVGGCGQEPPIADAAEFCNDKRWWQCRRDNVFGRLSDEEFTACITPIESECAGASWESGCTPTQQQADACLTLLQRADLGNLTNEELLSTYGDCNLCM